MSFKTTLPLGHERFLLLDTAISSLQSTVLTLKYLPDGALLQYFQKIKWYIRKRKVSHKRTQLYMLVKSWAWAEKALCSVAYLPKTHSVFHRLPDSLPPAGQNSPVCWRLSSWMLSAKSILLGNFGCEPAAERSIIYGMKEFHSVTVQK